jgi:hypothetical protein
MPTLNRKNLVEFLGLAPADAKTLEALARAARTHGEIDRVLDHANVLLKGKGIEALQGEYTVDRYYWSIVGLYVNREDSCVNTVLFDTARERWLVVTVEDWVTANERRYRFW